MATPYVAAITTAILPMPMVDKPGRPDMAALPDAWAVWMNHARAVVIPCTGFNLSSNQGGIPVLTIALPKRQREVLTAMQARFVAAYTADPRRDPAIAAAAAGFSAKSSKAQGYALLRKPHVRRACALRDSGAVTEEDAKGPMSREEAVQVLNTIARTGPAGTRLAALRMLSVMEGWEQPAAQSMGPLGQSILAADEARARGEITKGDSPVPAGWPCNSPADAAVADDLE